MKDIKIVVHTKDFGKIESSWQKGASHDDYVRVIQSCEQATRGELNYLSINGGNNTDAISFKQTPNSIKLIPFDILKTSIIEVLCTCEYE